jgi:hypothetical protein
MLAIRLNKNIDPNWILKNIQELINSHGKTNSIEDSVLCIRIQTIEQTSNELIFKLENTLEK